MILDVSQNVADKLLSFSFVDLYVLCGGYYQDVEAEAYLGCVGIKLLVISQGSQVC